MPSFSGAWSGISRLHAEMTALDRAADAGTRETLTVLGALTTHEAQNNFSGSHAKGQPHTGGDKPNVVTGYLRRSITMKPVIPVGPGLYETEVGIGAKYGRRVENGFTGSDSIGRKYNQPAFPFFDPAVKKTLDKAEETAAAIYAKHFAPFK
jgi:hypothetical protein